MAKKESVETTIRCVKCLGLLHKHILTLCDAVSNDVNRNINGTSATLFHVSKS